MLDSQCQPASLSQHLKRGNSWCALLCHFPTLLPQGYHSRHRQSAAADKPDDRQEPGAAADGDAWPSDEVLSQRVRHLFTLLAQAVVLAESQGLLMPLPGEGLALSERLLQLPPSAGDLVVNPTSSSGSCCCLLLTFWVMRGARCSICVCVCSLYERRPQNPPRTTRPLSTHYSQLFSPLPPVPTPTPPPKHTVPPHPSTHTYTHTKGYVEAGETFFTDDLWEDDQDGPLEELLAADETSDGSDADAAYYATTYRGRGRGRGRWGGRRGRGRGRTPQAVRLAAEAAAFGAPVVVNAGE